MTFSIWRIAPWIEDRTLIRELGKSGRSACQFEASSSWCWRPSPEQLSYTINGANSAQMLDVYSMRWAVLEEAEHTVLERSVGIARIGAKDDIMEE